MNYNKIFSYGYGEDYKFKKIASYCFGKTLDIGCAWNGNPYITSPVTGLDIRPKSQWKIMPPNYVKTIIKDATKMNFKREFDCIVGSELIEHLRDPYAFFERSNAALKTNGRLILSTDNPYRIQTLVANVLVPEGIGKSGSIGVRDFGHVNFFVPRMLNDLAAQTGFKVVSVVCGGGLPFPFLQQKWIYVYEKKG